MIETQTPTERFLTEVLQSHSPSHAYLFFGSPRSAKEEKAKEFGMALLCLKQGITPCRECLACKKIETGNHPDFRMIEPDGDKIKIAQIRAIKREAQYGPMEGATKIFVILNGEALTEEAAQSMLKLLEEPPPRLLFILVAGHPSALLPTIASRCQWVPFPDEPQNMDDAKEWEELITAASDSLFSEMQPGLELFDRVTVLEDFKEDWEKLIHLLLAFYRDVAVLKSGWEEGMLFPQYKQFAQPLANRLSWYDIWDRSRKISETEAYLNHSGNFRLGMETLLFKLFTADF